MISLYSRFIKRKFFNRLLIIYTAIIILTVILFSMSVIHSLKRSAEQDGLHKVKESASSAMNYMEEKSDSVTLLTRQIYLNPVQHQSMMDFLSRTITNYNEVDYIGASVINNYLNAVASQDNDIFDAVLYKKISEDLMFTSNYLILNSQSFIANNTSSFRKMDDAFYGLSITPSYLQDYATSKQLRIFSISSNIRAPFALSDKDNTSLYNRSIAILTVNYNAERIVGHFDKIVSGKFSPEIIVLSQNGDVILDTTGDYYGKTYPHFRQDSPTPITRLEEASLVSSLYNEKLGYYVVAILPRSQIMVSIQSSINTVVLIAAACAAFALCFGIVSIRLFSRRVNLINKAIQKVQMGNLNYQIPVSKNQDEINSIAVNFNHMCNTLKDYINKIYISDLLQKDAQIHALQAQINPHFLYNTLEVIRMEALSYGDESTGHMIELLAQLFRNSIKGELVVTIKDELEFCNSYLEMYHVRYSNNLVFDFRIDESIHRFGIPKHLLQPIIENALIHAVDHSRPENHITIHGYRQEQQIVIEISDDGRGMNDSTRDQIREQLRITSEINHNKIGLSNVHRRIQLLFGKEYGVDIDSKSDRGTTVRICIPTKSREEMLSDVQSFAG